VDCFITDTKAIESNPNDATAYLDRGTAHLKASEFDSAIADFTKAKQPGLDLRGDRRRTRGHRTLPEGA
jgi:Flp pilus assembly protein TadD